MESRTSLIVSTLVIVALVISTSVALPHPHEPSVKVIDVPDESKQPSVEVLPVRKARQYFGNGFPGERTQSNAAAVASSGSSGGGGYGGFPGTGTSFSTANAMSSSNSFEGGFGGFNGKK